ncbi:hypothetical protein I7I48_07029 [Histoplasma ohiense]|nr:hypothetical protein I7I48_07029 [Histoplasma ohiense (nom. inval.)]
MKNARRMPPRVNMTSSGQFPFSPCLLVLSQGDNMMNPRFIVVRESGKEDRRYPSSNQRFPVASPVSRGPRVLQRCRCPAA